MTPEEIAVRQRMRDDFAHYAKKSLRLRTKTGSVEQFVMNQAQWFIHNCLEEQIKQTGKARALILKGRQMGASTYVGGRYYWKVSQRKGVRAFILTHEAESTSALFEMTERYHDNCNALVKPTTGASNARELIFEKLDSGYKVGTAGNKAVGRGTTIQYFHGSEVAFWPNAAEHAKGILQAVPDAPDTEVILESTANGIGNFFHQQWLKAESGESDYQAIFVPWFWQDEYRKETDEGFRRTAREIQLADTYSLDDEQVNFMRSKIAELSAEGIDGEDSFKQEYPMTASEAFVVSGQNTLISPVLASKARKHKVLAYGPLIIGVDPARYGDDRTAIIRRRGRAAYDLETFEDRSVVEVAGIVASIIDSEKPDQVAIDVGGLGAGVFDILEDRGYQDVVVAINFGSAAHNPELYLNRRAEMWWEMRNWLDSDLDVMIPDRNDLHTDICAPQYKYNSQSRRQLESKDAIKKRGFRSPDAGDCLALTFAEPYKPKNNVHVDVHVADRVTGY